MLLTDNAPTHMLADAEVEQEHGFNVMNLSDLKIVFLPANTTSVVQSYTRA
jgi:ornithine carbamoyltransferase